MQCLHHPKQMLLSRERGNEPEDPLGNQRGWFIGVILSFPVEHQQEKATDQEVSAQTSNFRRARRALARQITLRA